MEESSGARSLGREWQGGGAREKKGGEGTAPTRTRVRKKCKKLMINCQTVKHFENLTFEGFWAAVEAFSCRGWSSINRPYQATANAGCRLRSARAFAVARRRSGFQAVTGIPASDSVVQSLGRSLGRAWPAHLAPVVAARACKLAKNGFVCLESCGPRELVNGG
jgi:hypothetical protein